MVMPVMVVDNHVMMMVVRPGRGGGGTAQGRDRGGGED